MKLGIIQGRLSKPINDSIQEFPKDTWENEFKILNNLGLSHIEWIVTKKSFSENIFKENIKKYSSYISSICCDHIIDNNIIYLDYLNEQLSPICEWALKNNVNSINIPLLEESKITEENKESLYKTLNIFSKKYKNLFF